jgi:hypothetical protein
MESKPQQFRSSKHLLVPTIRINESTVQRLNTEATKSAQPGGSDSEGIIVGHADYDLKKPIITFSQYHQYNADCEDQIPDSSQGEILGFVLFQSGIEIDWESSVQNYLDANQSSTNYTSSYYYQPVFIVSFSDRLELYCHLMTPNISLTATRIGDNPRNCESKKRHSYATYANVRERNDHVDATFLGITGVDDPQIVALSYSLTLTFQPKPIHALIATSVYKIEVTGAVDILFYGGSGRLDNGSAVFTLACDDDWEEESAPGISQKLGELREKIETLQDRIECRQAFRETLESRELEKQQTLKKILDALNTRQSYDPARLPRFAPPRPAIQPKPRRPIEISASIFWEAPNVDLDPNPEVSETSRPQQSKRAPLTTPRNQENLSKRFLVRESPSTEAKRAPNPMVRFPMVGETSLCLDDDSKFDDMTSFYHRIGLYANE